MEKEDIIVMNVPLKFVNQRIEDYAMQVTYDPKEDRGQVVYNLSVIRTPDLNKAVRVIKDVCRSGICASTMIRFEHSGARIEDYVIPEGMTGLMTICSTTLDGLLLNRGVPMNPVGGGVVEVEERVPRRFTHLIRYEYTTIDPLQVLISQEITSITRVMKSGNGNILANIRECHMEAEPILAGLPRHGRRLRAPCRLRHHLCRHLRGGLSGELSQNAGAMNKLNCHPREGGDPCYRWIPGQAGNDIR